MLDERSDYRLDYAYTRDSGRVFLTSLQALARIVPEQLRRDRIRGLDTAALLSGYPGSPLGGFDLEVQRMKTHHSDLPIVHRPAVNEELGASAVMGSQLAAARPDAKYHGVVGVWYGKAPGLDRATDAVRHGVFAGTSEHGGVVALVGDDPAAKSSTMPSSSDAALVDLHMPILYPADTAECLSLGLHAIAISRASGLWAAMKIVTPVADGSGTVDLPVLDEEPHIPLVEIEGKRWTSTPNAVFLGSARMVEMEREFRQIRSKLAYQYGVENRLNEISVDPPDAWIGLVATGYTYSQMLEALRRLGLPDAKSIADAGIRILQLRMPVPFNKDMVREFGRGLEEVVVVEEKNPTLEWLVKDALYDSPHRPKILGKEHEDGTTLMREYGLLDADAILPGLRRRLAQRLDERLAEISPVRERMSIPLNIARTPFFCSGCPHNWGTKVPEGALVGAGTGCHGMSLLMDPDLVGETFGITAMGNEGAHWIGMQPFVETEHVYQNFGDGTYFHSGQVAIQAAIGAGVSITFKILYNDTVAMTGGQDAAFSVGVPQLAQILLAQGVKRVLITSDDPHQYRRGELPPSVQVWPRDRILEAQEQLASIAGVTVLIHDQACANELRRARRRGKIETPRTRIVINHRICEGCGDCGDVSNCLSVQPVDTPLGRKTQIDQATCNFDYSCVKGDCPAFMEVDAGDEPLAIGAAPPPIVADPTFPAADLVTIRLAGIGGTGVVTAAQVLAAAAMMDGWDVHGLDQTGLSQKAGPVVSDIVLSKGNAHVSNLVGEREADTIVAFDQLVVAHPGVLKAGETGRTVIISSTERTPTGKMISAPETPYPTQPEIDEVFALRSDRGRNRRVAARTLATALTGEPATANILLLGAAVQTGSVPVSPASIMRAIELNGVAVSANQAAFTWGRAWSEDPEATASIAESRRLASGLEISTQPLPPKLERRIERLETSAPLASRLRMLAADLADYQDIRYAGKFLDLVARVVAAEHDLEPRRDDLSLAVADSLHKLMAYKDEYEVARLMLLPEAEHAAASVGGAKGRVRWMLHPPLLRAMGLQSKLGFGERSRPIFAALRRGKRLRGTAFDPFGHTEMRKLERSLIPEYVAAVDRLVAGLDTGNYDEAVRIALLPDHVRGFEDLKLRRAGEYRAELQRRIAVYGT